MGEIAEGAELQYLVLGAAGHPESRSHPAALSWNRPADSMEALGGTLGTATGDEWCERGLIDGDEWTNSAYG